MKLPHPAQIEALGVWSLRLGLLLGAIALAWHGKDEASGTCACALILSFLLL